MDDKQAVTAKIEVNHTPGPWTAEKDNEASEKYNEPFWSIESGKGFHSNHTGFGLRGIISNADACLITAAPDLYEALSNIENDDGRIPQTIWDMRNAALAKALGEGGAS